ncbi:MAG TPA: tetratricopeptide repeat protein [Blastocatellia bacterium]|nr:tetratricopeptide repeat protein [Blastocatellia bacterium]
MLQNIPSLRLIPVLFTIALLASLALAQASPAIQFFMPDGSLPSREIRFTMAMDNGRIETFFSDSKGKFMITRSLGLKPDGEYRVTVVSDGASYDTTSVTFKEYGVYYITIYLKRFTARPAPPAKVIDIAELDLRVPEEAKRAYAAAMRAFGEGNRDEVIQELERALTIYPDYFRALNGLGLIYMKMDRLDDATRMFERASKIAPRVYQPRMNLGIILTRRGKYKEAAAMLEALHKENQSVSEVRLALGDVLIALNRLDEAEPHLRTALLDSKLDRQGAGNAHYRLGLLLNKTQRYEAAVVELSQAADLLPNAGRIRLQLGGALLQLERLDDAERELLAAYRLGGIQLGGAQLMLGQIYFIEKKYDGALRAFEQYLADVPAPPNADQIRGVIDKIKTALNQN